MRRLAEGIQLRGSFMVIGASASVESSVSASIELGSSRRYGVQTVQSRTVSVAYNVLKDYVGALWSDAHEPVPIRGDGTLVSASSLRPL